MRQPPPSRGFGNRGAESFADLIRQVQEEAAALDARLAAEDEAMAQWESQRAQAARSGAMGAQWKAVQQRIDAGQTTMVDVMTGVDSSVEATSLRDMSHRNLSTLREQWDESDEDAEPTPAARLGAAAADSERRRQELMQQIIEELRA